MMIKHVWIDGCRYTYDAEMYIVIIMSLKTKPYREGCYQSNALFHKTLAFSHRSVLRCRMYMADVAVKICPGVVYHSKKDVHEKPSGLYDGNNIIYKVGGWNFRHIFYSGNIRLIQDEINILLSYGESYAREFLELLVRKNLAEQLHMKKMTKGMPRCHHPLVHSHPETDTEESEYWQGRRIIESVNMPRYYFN